VVWRDPLSGLWHANDDACPHRLAPLSEGRIEVRKGEEKGGKSCESCVLACAYHGEFFPFSSLSSSPLLAPSLFSLRSTTKRKTKLLCILFPLNDKTDPPPSPPAGWEFNSKGSCTRIPQLEDDPAARATALASPRSRARSYPVCVKAGLVFVWPDADPGAQERASRAALPPVPAEVVDKVEESGWWVFFSGFFLLFSFLFFLFYFY